MSLLFLKHLNHFLCSSIAILLIGCSSPKKYQNHYISGSTPLSQTIYPIDSHHNIFLETIADSQTTHFLFSKAHGVFDYPISSIKFTLDGKDYWICATKLKGNQKILLDSRQMIQMLCNRNEANEITIEIQKCKTSIEIEAFFPQYRQMYQDKIRWPI